MKVVIVGCGKAGSAIINSMANEGHDITAIDSNFEVIQNVANVYDLIAVHGNATSRALLVEAGVAKADLFVAVTERDEVNMLSCFLAKKLGVPYTVARVRGAEYNGDGLHELKTDLELSMALNPDYLAAEELFNTLKMPSSVQVQTFAGKRVQMLEMVIREQSKLVGVTLADLRKKCKVPFVVCAVKRQNLVHIPNGMFTLQQGDKIAFIVKSADAHKLLKSLDLVQKSTHDVILLGGSSTAAYLAKMLAANNYYVKIIDHNKQRCADLADMLPGNATIILGDATNQELLLEERIQSTDAIVALTGEDEQNILVSFYARSQNVPKVITKVNNNALASLAERLGLDGIIQPLRIVADQITMYARALKKSMGSKVETMYSLMDGHAEALEFEVLANNRLVGIPLKDLQLKPNFIIAGILRNKETLIPTGANCILQGDKVIVVAANTRLDDLADIVR